MSILFINASPNKHGNTVRMAEELLRGRDYESLHLMDYKIYDYGQDFPDDQLEQVLERVFAADTLVIGSPVYWHSFSGQLRNFLDRQYGLIDQELAGKRLFFIFQGQAPTAEIEAMADYTMSRYAGLYGMSYQGRATYREELAALRAQL